MTDNLCSSHAFSSLDTPGSTDAFIVKEATLQEIFAAPGDATAIGLALAQVKPRSGILLWVQERGAMRELGRVFAHGLPPILHSSILHVVTRNAKDALWAMEEGLKCSTLAAVIGELHGDPRSLDFTATRRLAVASERYGVPAFVIRSGGQADLSGARRRWRVESRPSLPHLYDPRAPGMPVWSLDLFRARDMQPGQWDVMYDRTAHRLDLVSDAGDGALAQSAS